MYKKLILIFLYSILIASFVWTEELHKIEKGETIYQISKQYDIPVNVLLEVNDISNPSDVPAGKSIQIPEHGGKIQTYIVQKGDTLYSIAHKYGLNLYELRSLNSNITDNIKIGQKINVAIKSTINLVSNANTTSENKKLTGLISIDKRNTARSIRTSSKNINTFGNITNGEFMDNSKSIGKVSGKWPVSGTGYLLNGKLPGMVIEGNENQPVQASRGGVVVYASLHTSFMNVVIIQGDDGIVYVYGGQKRLYVEQGDRVNKGSVIGLLGVMPVVQKPVLYFSVWDKNVSLDPRIKIG